MESKRGVLLASFINTSTEEETIKEVEFIVNIASCNSLFF